MSNVTEGRAREPVGEPIGQPIRAAMRRVDRDACADPSAWYLLSPDGFPAPFDSFDLMPHRAAQVDACRRRSRIGWIAAIAGGLASAAILQWYAAFALGVSRARYEDLTQQLASFGPALAERQRLQTSLAAAAAHDARLAALVPRRQQVIALLDALEQAAQEGVAVTSVMQEDVPEHDRTRDDGHGMRDGRGNDAGRSGGSGGVSGPGSGGGGDRWGVGGGDGDSNGQGTRGGDRRDGGALIRVAGFADDADAVARWSARLCAHPAIERVELDTLRRLADPVSAASGLNVFRITARMVGPHR